MVTVPDLSYPNTRQSRKAPADRLKHAMHRYQLALEKWLMERGEFEARMFS
jgi:hypothetical protein